MTGMPRRVGEDTEPGPIVGSALWPIRVDPRGWERRCRLGAVSKGAVLVVADLFGSDRRQAGDHDDLVGQGQLHYLARGQKRTRRLLARDHQVCQPGAQPVPGIVLHCPLLGRDAERVRDALCGPLVVAGESNADVAVVENAVVLAVGLRELVQ